MGAVGTSRRCRIAWGLVMVQRYEAGSRLCGRPAHGTQQWYRMTVLLARQKHDAYSISALYSSTIDGEVSQCLLLMPD